MLELILYKEGEREEAGQKIKTECFELDNSCFLGFYQNTHLIGQLCMEGQVKIQYLENSGFRIVPVCYDGVFGVPSSKD